MTKSSVALVNRNVSSPYSAAGYDYRNFVQELLEPQMTMEDVKGGAGDGI